MTFTTITQSDNAITHNAMQRRCRRNEKFVNTLKMASGCCGCGFKPQSEAECRLLDLNHYGGGRVGAWAEKSVGKTADVARLVWSGASLQRIMDENRKRVISCVRIAMLWNTSMHQHDCPKQRHTPIKKSQSILRKFNPSDLTCHTPMVNLYI